MLPFRWIALNCAGLLSGISSVAAAQALTTNTVVHGTIALGQVQTYTFSADLNNSAYVSCVEREACEVGTQALRYFAVREIALDHTRIRDSPVRLDHEEQRDLALEGGMPLELRFEAVAHGGLLAPHHVAYLLGRQMPG